MSLEFFITSLIVVLLPGTGVIYTISVGLTRSAKASIFAAVGCTAGIIPHMLAGILGLAAILHTSAVIFQIFKFCGVLYLAYLALCMWRDAGSIDFETDKTKPNYREISVRGFLINILNPKLSIFFLAFLPQFATVSTASTIHLMLGLGLVFMLMTFVVFVAYGLMADRLRACISQSPRLIHSIQKSFAALFLALGLKLAFSER